VPGTFYLFQDELIHEDGRIDQNMLTVYLSNVLIAKWRLYFYENPRESEKIMLRIGNDFLQILIKNGIVDRHEEFDLVAAGQPAKCPYDPALLIETRHAEYEIELPAETDQVNIHLSTNSST
jgi:hypothetical protein